MIAQQRTNNGYSRTRADVSLPGNQPDAGGAEEARYPYNMAGQSVSFRPQDFQPIQSRPAKLHAIDGAALHITRALREKMMEHQPQESLEGIVLHILRHLLAMGVSLPQSLVSEQAAAPAVTPAVAPAVTPAGMGLTPRETEVLQILMQGKSNKMIGRELNIAESTVKLHAKSVCRKLNVARRTEVIVAAIRMGWMGTN